MTRWTMLALAALTLSDSGVWGSCGASWSSSSGGSWLLGESGASDCSGCGTSIASYAECAVAAAAGMSQLGIGALGGSESWSGPSGCHIQDGSNFRTPTHPPRARSLDQQLDQ